jgi:hypothetical protein
MSTACVEVLRAPDGTVVYGRRGADRVAISAAAGAVAETGDAKVYLLISKTAREVDLEAEFAVLAAEAEDWATDAFEVGSEVWPAE